METDTIDVTMAIGTTGKQYRAFIHNRLGEFQPWVYSPSGEVLSISGDTFLSPGDAMTAVSLEVIEHKAHHR